MVRRSTLRSDIGNTASAAATCDVELDRGQIRTYLGAIYFTDSRYRAINTFITGSSERIAVRGNGMMPNGHQRRRPLPFGR